MFLFHIKASLSKKINEKYPLVRIRGKRKEHTYTYTRTLFCACFIHLTITLEHLSTATPGRSTARCLMFVESNYHCSHPSLTDGHVGCYCENLVTNILAYISLQIATLEQTGGEPSNSVLPPEFSIHTQHSVPRPADSLVSSMSTFLLTSK